jgi:hypothetical protein
MTMDNFDLAPASNQSFTPMTQGLYDMEVVGMEKMPPSGQYADNNKFRILIRLIVRGVIDANDVTAVKHLGSEFWGFCADSMHVKSTMRPWTEALLGRPLVDGERLTAQDLIGKRAKVQIVHYRREDGKTGDKIGSMAPLKTQEPTPQNADF